MLLVSRMVPSRQRRIGHLRTNWRGSPSARLGCPWTLRAASSRSKHALNAVVSSSAESATILRRQSGSGIWSTDGGRSESRVMYIESRPADAGGGGIGGRPGAAYADGADQRL